MKPIQEILGPVLIALLLAAPLARADGGSPARIRDVRIGSHEDYERLVIELDSDADVVWENGPEPGEESFYIAAAPAQPSRVIATKLPRMGTVSVTEMKGGTHIAVEPRARRVRAYTLTNPPRLVIDFAAPGNAPFTAPAGSRALEAARTIGPLVTAPEPTPVPAPEPKPAPTPVVAKTEPPAPPALEPEPKAAPEPTPVAQVAPTPAPEAPEAAIPPSAQAPAPEPKLAKPAKPAKPLAKPAPAAPTSESPFPWSLALGALLGVLALVAAIVLVVRRRAAESDLPIVPFPPEAEEFAEGSGLDDILPAEVYTGGEQEAALEKRLDAEVRARVELEQRLAGANEELKVMRDRLHRLERRREGSS